MLKIIKDSSMIRRGHNESLIRRMRSGEPLWSFDSKASWYPPRPIIKKDPQAIARLYAESRKNEMSLESEIVETKEPRVVSLNRAS